MPENDGTMGVRARYVGGYIEQRDDGGALVSRTPAAYLAGIPARDLSGAEFDALAAEDQERVRRCGLYEVAPDPAAGRRAARAT